MSHSISSHVDHDRIRIMVSFSGWYEAVEMPDTTVEATETAWNDGCLSMNNRCNDLPVILKNCYFIDLLKMWVTHSSITLTDRFIIHFDILKFDCPEQNLKKNTFEWNLSANEEFCKTAQWRTLVARQIKINKRFASREIESALGTNNFSSYKIQGKNNCLTFPNRLVNSFIN